MLPKVKHGSLFAGIGGFDLGFERAGIETVWTVENDKNCNIVLKKHWPNVERYGDVKDVGKRNLEPVDIISGGFPCQDLSVAGRREGLAGERSGLWFEFARVIEEMAPEWVVVENVPGLLSSQGGRDFLVILRTLEQFGYCGVWRVLDSQYFGVPQRRRRVFVVGHLRGTGSLQVLLESESGEGDIAKSGETWQRIAAPIKASSPSTRRGGSNPIAEEFVVDALQARDYKGVGTQYVNEGKLVGAWSIRTAHTKANENNRWWYEQTPPLYGSEPVVVSENQRAEVRLMPYSRQLTSGGGKPGQGYPCVAFNWQSGGDVRLGITEDRTTPLHSSQVPAVQMSAVRRLTPTECERLQGFPDGWTEGLSDSARYRCLGNAVTVNVAEWIGRRIIAAK